MTLLVKNLSKKYKNNTIVHDLNFCVEEGECLALLGPSGCGKSTTLRLIAGLETANRGKIHLNSVDISLLPPQDRKIGMVFQNYALYPHLTVKDNLTLGLKVRRTPSKLISAKVSIILEILKLLDVCDRYPGQLSGGQRQRVALGRALLREANAYLLDEPMSNLDAQLKETLRPQIRNTILNRGQPILYVTHDQQEAMALADKIALMDEGKIIQIGTPYELYKQPNSIFTAKFIGSPQINVIHTNDRTFTAIRPENIQLSNTGIRCKVIQKEWLGVNQLIYLDSPYGIIKVITNPSSEIKEEVYVTWEKSNEHIFSKIDGSRINQ